MTQAAVGSVMVKQSVLPADTASPTATLRATTVPEIGERKTASALLPPVMAACELSFATVASAAFTSSSACCNSSSERALCSYRSLSRARMTFLVARADRSRAMLAARPEESGLAIVSSTWPAFTWSPSCTLIFDTLPLTRGTTRLVFSSLKLTSAGIFTGSVTGFFATATTLMWARWCSGTVNSVAFDDAVAEASSFFACEQPAKQTASRSPTQ